VRRWGGRTFTGEASHIANIIGRRRSRSSMSKRGRGGGVQLSLHWKKNFTRGSPAGSVNSVIGEPPSEGGREV